MQSISFFTSVIKIFLDIFWKNFGKSISSGGCHVTIIGGLVHKKSMIFEVLWEYLGEFFIYFLKSFVIAISYLLVYFLVWLWLLHLPWKRGSNSQFWQFFKTIFGIFRAVCLGTNLWPRVLLFTKNSFNVYTFTCSKIFFHDINLWANNKYNTGLASKFGQFVDDMILPSKFGEVTWPD